MRKIGLFAAVLISLFGNNMLHVIAISDRTESSIEVFFNNPYEQHRDDTLQSMILEEIENAESRIYVATYNFTDTKTAQALIQAFKRGVEVRIVIHAENSDSDVMKDLARSGIKIQKSNSDGLMHAKFIVIDYDLTISGSANMTPGSFFYDNNFMFRIVSSEMNSIFLNEFNEMFISKKFGSNSPKTKSSPTITLEDGTKILIRFAPEDNISNSLLSLIQASKKSIYVLAYSFASNDLGNALIDRYDDGLDIKVIFEGEKAFSDSGGEARYLQKAGVPIFMDGSDDSLMHEKVFIFDESVVSAGSYNFTRSADTKNDEQILIVQNKEIVDAFLDEFDKIYEEAK